MKLFQDKCSFSLEFWLYLLNCYLIVNNELFPMLAPDFCHIFLTHCYLYFMHLCWNGYSMFVLPYCLFTCLYLCILSQANDGSFMEEPGSGAVATVGEKQVAVGTLDWIRRYKWASYSSAMPYAKFTNNVDTFNCLFFPLYLMSTMQIGLEHYGNYLLFCSSILAMASMIVCCVNGSLFPS